MLQASGPQTGWVPSEQAAGAVTWGTTAQRERNFSVPSLGILAHNWRVNPNSKFIFHFDKSWNKLFSKSSLLRAPEVQEPSPPPSSRGMSSTWIIKENPKYLLSLANSVHSKLPQWAMISYLFIHVWLTAYKARVNKHCSITRISHFNNKINSVICFA